jgi:hypothetical protein
VARSIANALSLADPAKLKAFLNQAGVSFKSGDPKAYVTASTDLLKFLVALDFKDFNTARAAASALVDSIGKAEALQETASLPEAFKYTVSGRVEVVAEELADALYPIIQQVKAADIGTFAGALVGLGATGNPKEIIKTIDAGLDAFLSVPPDRIFSAIRSLKDAVNEAVDAPKCNLICVAPKETVQKFSRDAATALSVTDPKKLKAFVDQAIKSFESGDRRKYASVGKEGRYFLETLNRADVQRVKAASLELLKASGSELYKDINWGYTDP